MSSSFAFHLCIYIFKILAFCSHMLQIIFVHFPLIALKGVFNGLNFLVGKSTSFLVLNVCMLASQYPYLP